jgi:hypothetical protein
LLNETSTPAWVRREILAGIRHFIPRPEGRMFAGARRGSSGAPRRRRSRRWPGGRSRSSADGAGGFARGGAARGGAGRGGMGRGGPMMLVGTLPGRTEGAGGSGRAQGRIPMQRRRWNC